MTDVFKERKYKVSVKRIKGESYVSARDVFYLLNEDVFKSDFIKFFKELIYQDMVKK